MRGPQGPSNRISEGPLLFFLHNSSSQNRKGGRKIANIDSFPVFSIKIALCFPGLFFPLLGYDGS